MKSYSSIDNAVNDVYRVMALRLDNVPLDEKDELLLSLIRGAIYSVLNYTGLEKLPKDLCFTAADVAMTAYNRVGSEGLQSESFAYGGSQTYSRDLPEDIKAVLRRYRRLPRR